MTLEDSFREAASIIRRAEAVLFTAGAGIGVDSGLPDFRGTEGFWRAYPPVAKLGLSFVEMANPAWFSQDPYLAWAFYGHRLNLYRRTRPHRGFSLLLEMAKGKPGGLFVFTSNVDGHFQKAGVSQTRIEECHGSIHMLQCIAPCGRKIWNAVDIEVDVDEKEFRAIDPLPSCPQCGGVARPNILMFGDWAWVGDRSESQAIRFRKWLGNVSHKGLSLVVVEIGAGKAVPTVRYQSERVSHSGDATLIRINPRDPEVPSDEDISLSVGAKEGIEGIWRVFRK